MLLNKRKELKLHTTGINEVGNRYGSLVVIERHGARNGSVAWLCQCDCGGTYVAVGAELRRGRTKSCCSCRSKYPANMPMRLRDKYAQYRRRAEVKGFAFSISPDEFYTMVCEPCHYCGAKATGLDRIDNVHGYTGSMLLPCCPQCNQSKTNLTYTEFTEWIKKVAKNLNLDC